MSDQELRERISLLTPKCVLSFPTLFEPRQVNNQGEPKYSVALVFPEGTDLSELKKAALEVARAAFGPRAPNMIRNQKVRWPFRGVKEPGPDDADDMAAKGYDVYGEGTVFTNASKQSKHGQPGIVSLIPDPETGAPAVIISQDGDIRFSDGTVVPKARPIWAGCEGQAHVTVYAYDVSGNKGVTLGLNHIQITGDGEHRLDNRTTAAAVFEADPDAVPDLSDLTGDPEEAESAEESQPAADGDDLSDLMG